MPFSSCLKYFGGKGKGISQLLNFFPSNWSNRCYVEPFAGSLSVFFNVAPKTAILNDMDEDLANFWEVVSGIFPDDYDAFTKLLKSSVYSIKFILDCEEELSHKTDGDPIIKPLRALIYYLRNRMSFSGFETLTDIIPNRNILHENLEEWHSFFENADVRIWHKDFREVFDRLDKSSNKWTPKFIYCDPPYVTAGTSYKHSFTEQDHLDLYEKLHKCKYDWVLSYDKHKLIEDLYRDYTIVPAKWFYSCAGGNTEQKEELIITNTVDGVDEI